MNGILNIDKPQGWTSHDVVSWVRRLLRIKRVGHAGTLDPMATGVLLVCIGQATRVAEYLMAGSKTYHAGIRLGVMTNTYDTDGVIVATAPVPPLLEASLETALAAFTGEILQTPPAFSAIKKSGVPLHRLARRGEPVRPDPRPVIIHRIDLLRWQPPDMELRIECEPGTYIRSVAHDLGQALGCGGVLTRLVRTRSGQFGIEDALSPDALGDAHAAGEFASHLHPLRAALSNREPVIVGQSEITALRNGRPIPSRGAQDRAAGYAVTPEGAVVAIVTYDAAGGAWRPVKVFSE